MLLENVCGTVDCILAVVRVVLVVKGVGLYRKFVLIQAKLE